jgi:hypothetical protein
MNKYLKLLSKSDSLLNCKLNVNNKNGLHLRLKRLISIDLNKRNSDKTVITTHHSIKPRDKDIRWKDIPMERVADETDVLFDSL